ncbi:MAG: helix-turn-helix domain-containing protein, partial [Alphaproteobacteria bacterium]
MLKIGEKPMVGHKIRRLRTQLELTQSDMAAAIGISASYLNLIEHNQRPVTVPLLFKLGQAFDIDLKDFAADDSTRQIADITEMFADPAMSGHSISKRELRDFVTSQLNIVASILQFYNSFKAMKLDIQNAATSTGSLRQRYQAVSVVEDIRAYLQDQGNYFDELETAAENFTASANLNLDTLFGDLKRWFKDEMMLDVQIVPAETMGNSVRRY